jgi:hypothetical protein
LQKKPKYVTVILVKEESEFNKLVNDVNPDSISPASASQPDYKFFDTSAKYRMAQYNVTVAGPQAGPRTMQNVSIFGSAFDICNESYI